MAFCGRARRDTFTFHPTTPCTVGPGTYRDVNTTRKSEPGFAPFSTTSHRVPIEDTRYLPGPGHYQDDEVKHQPNPFLNVEREMGAFASVSSRFHVDKATSILSPGPGTYQAGNVWVKNKHRYWSEPPKRRVDFNRIGTVPSVPARDQSFGYEEDEAGTLIMQAPPLRGHTGFGQDSVGPGEYTPNMSAVKISKATNFGASKSRRTEWKDKKKTPGPGMYEGTDGVQQKENVGHAFPEDHQSSSFVSKTKMIHQKVLKQHEYTPGPGSYSPEKALAPKRAKSVPSMQFFGSTQHRSFQQDLSKMHAAPMSYKTPGPGMYDSKKKVTLQPNTNAAPQQKSGFNQSSARFNPADTPVPGPGNYATNDETGIAATLKSRVVSRGGAFGSSGARTDTQAPTSSMMTPGPGNYTASPLGPNDTKAHTSHMFASKSTRFKPPKGPTAVDYSDVEDPEDQPRGDPALLGPGAYHVQDGWSGGSPNRIGRNKPPGFSSSTDRFKLVAVGERAPGPGEYDVLGINMKPLVRPACGFVTKESRFRITPSHVPGPGHYHPEHADATLCRSFNVTVDGHLIT